MRQNVAELHTTHRKGAALPEIVPAGTTSARGTLHLRGTAGGSLFSLCTLFRERFRLQGARLQQDGPVWSHLKLFLLIQIIQVL